MAVPRFFDRVADASSAAVGLDRDELRVRLEGVTVALAAHPDTVPDPGAFDLAANLLARLYPRIAVSGPANLADAAKARIIAVNPDCDLVDGGSDGTPEILWSPRRGTPQQVTVWACGWNVVLDGAECQDAPAISAAAFAAACIGVGELFRLVFAEELGARGRRGPTPASFNLVTLGDAEELEPGLGAGADIGRAALVGAGAIGQAALLTLRANDCTGQLAVIDPEKLELSNLQRYVLGTDADVGAQKTALAARELQAGRIRTNKLACRWGDPPVANLRVDSVLVALDSAQARIEVQAGLPGRIYNAWTQPRDLGWSRHENFGIDPCLACLYWPDRPRPHRYQVIAQELGLDEQRVLIYLAGSQPIGTPLAPGVPLPQLPGTPVPANTDRWWTTPLIVDIAAENDLAPERLSQWGHRSLDDFYREAICGGALLDMRNAARDRTAEVPMAHQSAFAGVMLASQLIIASTKELASRRPLETEGRYNVLAPLPQLLSQPRQKSERCICSDPDFLAEATDSPPEVP